MIGQLTMRERQLALVILCAMAVLGLLMMVAGRNDPLGAQGGLVALMALFAIFGVISGYFNFNHYEPKAATAKVKPKEECAYCHIASAKKDDVWTQFYRLLDN